MAGPGSAGYLTSYDIGFAAGSGNKEDLLDIITNLDPWDTPFYSSAPKVEARHTTHEWLVDTLNATSTAGAAEGGDFLADTMTARTRLTNITQIFRKDIAVTDTQRTLNPAGIRDEYEYQIMKAMREIARNIETTCFRVTPASVAVSGDEVTARTMKPIRGFAVTLLGTTGLIATANVLGLHETLYTQGGNPDTLYLSPGVKADFTNVCVSGTSKVSMNIALGEKKLINNIDVFESDFGLLAVIPDRFVFQASATAQSGGAFLMERAKARIASLRPVRHVPIGKGGDSTRGMVLGELTLEILHPSAHGVITGITT